MYRVGLEEFKSLQEARDHIAYELPYGLYPIYSIDGVLEEAWKGRNQYHFMEGRPPWLLNMNRVLTDEEILMATEYRTPLVFTNQLPEFPVTMQVGELQETRNKDGKRLKVSFVTPFNAMNRGQEIQVVGDATIYWKNIRNDGQPETEGPALLQALGAAGKSIGDTCSICRLADGTFQIGEADATAAPPPSTPPQSPAAGPTGAPQTPPQTLNANPVTAEGIVRVYQYYLMQAQAMFHAGLKDEDNLLKDYKVADLVSLAMGMAQKHLDERTVMRDLFQSNPDDLPL